MKAKLNNKKKTNNLTIIKMSEKNPVYKIIVNLKNAIPNIIQ